MIKFLIAKLCKKVFSPSAIRDSRMDKTARVGDGCSITRSSFGRYSYAADYTHITETDIGNFTSISHDCAIGGGSHAMDWASTSPVFTNTRSILRVNFTDKPYQPYKRTKIGNDVWIGADVIIKSGVSIGDGAVIGMGSVVTHDVPPYEVWAGNPAHQIKMRFDDETIAKLIDLKWWTWSDEEIRHYAEYFDSADELYKRYKKRS